MSPTRIAPTLADSPVDGAPAQGAAHHAPAPFDPQMIAGLANAFFQAPPASLASAPVPFGLPVPTPNLPDAPAPSVVTTAAPFAPARAPLGPPDIPPTTIPSVVPTPNIPAPSAPTTLQSSTRPLGLADVPQPGASAGGASPSAAPTDIDYSAIPRLLAGDLTLVPPSHAGAPGLGEAGLGEASFGEGTAAVPGGSAPAQIDNLYFLHDRAPLGAPGAPLASPAPASPRVVEPVDPIHPGQGSPEDFVIAGPSEADPHRFSDAAALATPPAPAPMPNGYESNSSPTRKSLANPSIPIASSATSRSCNSRCTESR